jgi:hypothetical protein
MRGLSPLSALRWDVATSRSAAESAAHLISNWSVPPGAWVPEKDAVVTTEDQRLIQRIFRALRGPRGRGKVPILTTPLRWQQMGLSPADAEWGGARRASRQAICAALGVPLILVGETEPTSVYRQTLDAERVFARTMQGELEMISDALQARVARDFGPHIVVAWDYSEIPALQVSWQERWDRWLAAVGALVVTPNEMRREFRLGGALPWGDQPTPRSVLNFEPTPVPAAASTDTTESPAEDAGEAHDPELAEVIRAFGRGLYRHPVVRAHIDAGVPLNVASLLGRPVPDSIAATVADGIRRRRSAEQIAAML